MPWWIIVYLLYHPLLVNLFRFVGEEEMDGFRSGLKITMHPVVLYILGWTSVTPDRTL
jgi:hypothetical protein